MRFIGFISQKETLHKSQTQSLGYVWFVISPKVFCPFRCMFIKNNDKVILKSCVVLVVDIEL